MAGTDPAKARDDVRAVRRRSEKYRQNIVLGEVWKRPGLSERDRSIVTFAALVRRNETRMSILCNLPRERRQTGGASESLRIWRSIPAGATRCRRSRSPRMCSRSARSGPTASAGFTYAASAQRSREADRAKRVGEQFGAVFPGVVQYTTDVLFRDLWLRPGLAPRDRSLVTISSLTASGQVAAADRSSEYWDEQWPHTGRDRGSHHASRLLRRLA